MPFFIALVSKVAGVFSSWFHPFASNIVMSFCGVTASHLVAAIQYHSVKFSTLLLAKAEEITQALLLRVLLEETEAVQQDPSKGNWSVIFKTISTAKRVAENGFTLLNRLACSLQQALDHRNSSSCTSGHVAHRYPNCATGIRPIQPGSSHLPL